MRGEFSVLLEGLAFPEGPRWRAGKLWFSDMHNHRVMTVDLDGRSETVVEVPTQPSGLGWRPDGTLLVVSMTDRSVLALEGGTLRRVADLSRNATWHCNDMVVDAQGRAYVGNFGFDLYAEPLEPVTTALIRVDLDGQARPVAEDLSFPNGTVITPDGKTLIVGESFAQRLTAFDVTEDGLLANRRVWAQLEDCTPDGIALDAEGGIWIASPISHECVRVEEGGRITHRLPVGAPEDGRQAFACMLGGPDGKTLFALTALESEPEKARALQSGRIEITRVDIPHAGLP